MSAIEQLLADVPRDKLEAYEAYLQTHLKLLMTGVSKARVQDLTQVTMRKNKCIEQCYRRELMNIGPDDWQQQGGEVVEGIRRCKEKCGKEKRAVKKYLDDINYYSSLKLQSCSSECTGQPSSKVFNNCYWGCLNRLDRRYKKYWVEQRQKIQQQFQ